jgi:hypothetical protein
VVAMVAVKMFPFPLLVGAGFIENDMVQDLLSKKETKKV